MKYAKPQATNIRPDNTVGLGSMAIDRKMPTIPNPIMKTAPIIASSLDLTSWAMLRPLMFFDSA
jgi:hypothetical protein